MKNALIFINKFTREFNTWTNSIKIRSNILNKGLLIELVKIIKSTDNLKLKLLYKLNIVLSFLEKKVRV